MNIKIVNRIGGDALRLGAGFIAFAASAVAAETVLPVVKEPHHHVVRENAYVRVIDASLVGGDATQYHRHAMPSVIVTLTDAPIETQVLGQPLSAPGPSIPGTVRYAPYDSAPLSHRVVNPGKRLFRTYDIELLRSRADAAKAPVGLLPGMTRVLNEDLVRAYRLRLGRHQKQVIPADACARMLIDITGRVVLTVGGRPRSLKDGDYVFADPGKELRPEALGEADCVVLQLP